MRLISLYLLTSITFIAACASEAPNSSPAGTGGSSLIGTGGRAESEDPSTGANRNGASSSGGAGLAATGGAPGEGSGGAGAGATNSGGDGADTGGTSPGAGGSMSCDAPHMMCGDSCISPSESARHCGGCAPEYAYGGQGGSSAVPPNCEPAFFCDGACRDLESDNDHCGSCDNECSEETICAEGTCTPICTAGQTYCHGNCQDSPVCGTNCAWNPGSVCEFGSCACPEGTSACQYAESRFLCADFQTDRNNCGACNHACEIGEECNAGECRDIVCQPGLALCGNDCADVSSNKKHCGGCSTLGAGGGGPGGAPGLPAECDPDCSCTLANYPDLCGSPGNEYCVNLAEDMNNCGTCGQLCNEQQLCQGGSCVAKCGPGTTYCDGTCVNGDTCGLTCTGDAAYCDSGSCACHDGQALCGTECADLKSNRFHCGSCAQYCGGSCDDGVCTGDPGGGGAGGAGPDNR